MFRYFTLFAVSWIYSSASDHPVADPAIVKQTAFRGDVRSMRQIIGTGSGPNDLLQPMISSTKLSTTTTSTESPPPTTTMTTMEPGPQENHKVVVDLLTGAQPVEKPEKKPPKTTMEVQNLLTTPTSTESPPEPVTRVTTVSTTEENLSNQSTEVNSTSSSLGYTPSGLYVRSTAKVIYGREKLRKKEKPGNANTTLISLNITNTDNGPGGVSGEYTTGLPASETTHNLTYNGNVSEIFPTQPFPENITIIDHETGGTSMGVPAQPFPDNETTVDHGSTIISPTSPLSYQGPTLNSAMSMQTLTSPSPNTGTAVTIGNSESTTSVHVPLTVPGGAIVTGYEPGTTEEPCVDTVDNCDDYPDSACNISGPYYLWAKSHCAAHCGFCSAVTTPHVCVDKIPNCNMYSPDLCVNAFYKHFVKDNCEAYCCSCGGCPVPTPSGPLVQLTPMDPTADDCRNILNNCDYYDDENCFNEYEPWARINCAMRCGYCVGKYETCKDYDKFCNLYEPGFCQQYSGWARSNCRETCQMCGPPVNPNNSTGAPSVSGTPPPVGGGGRPTNPSVNQTIAESRIPSVTIDGAPSDKPGYCYYSGHYISPTGNYTVPCDRNCKCVNVAINRVICTNICPDWISYPSTCRLEKPSGQCCQELVCNGDEIPATASPLK